MIVLNFAFPADVTPSKSQKKISTYVCLSLRLRFVDDEKNITQPSKSYYKYTYYTYYPYYTYV